MSISTHSPLDWKAMKHIAGGYGGGVALFKGDDGYYIRLWHGRLWGPIKDEDVALEVYQDQVDLSTEKQ